MLELGERIKKARNKAGLTQKELAKKAGMKSQGALSDLENGRNKTSSSLFEIAKVTSVNYEWLLTGEGEINPTTKDGTPISELEVSKIIDWDDSTEIDDDFVPLPFFKNSEFRGGNGSFELPDYEDRKLMFSKRTLRNIGADYHSCFANTLRGNSMLSASLDQDSIPDGSTCLYDRSKTKIVDDEIYAVMHDGLFRVKRLRNMPGGGVALISNNPDKVEYPTDEITKEQKEDPSYFEVIGWLVHYQNLRKWRG